MNRILSSRFSATLLMTLLLAITSALYWRGLSGPFLLDDPYGLQYLSAWREGKQTLWIALFNNESVLMHRALAMASFAVNMVIGGDSTFSFKLGNLLHHLAAAVFVYLLVSQMFLRDKGMAPRAMPLALLITALWLLHPLHVSTVLYVIQRMAQISALFSVAGMWMYMVVRQRMEAGAWSQKRGMWVLWIAIPAMTFFGIQGKQNAAVLPMLCLVLELAYFGGFRTMPKSLRAFYAVSVLAPLVALAVALGTGSDTIYIGYYTYDFSMGERLLSEARALCIYIKETLIPYPPGMGIYADDFPVSRGLLVPWTTLASIIGLGLASVMAIRMRRVMPSLFAGWFLFLVGHAVESSFIPLELYYEHRNYLPSVGVLICVVSLVCAALAALHARGVRISRIATAGAAGALLVLAIQTGGRVHVWQRLDTLLRSSVDAHPESIHANYALLNSLLLAKRHDEIETRLDELLKSPNARTRASALIYRMNVSCGTRRIALPDDLDAYMQMLPEKRIELPTTQALSSFIDIAERQQNACGPVTFRMLADHLRALADRATGQPVGSFTLYTTRHQAARMYLAAGDSSNAVIQARLAWQPTTPPTYCAALIRALLLENRIAEAEQVLREARARINPRNKFDRDGMKVMQQLIDEAKRARDARSQSM